MELLINIYNVFLDTIYPALLLSVLVTILAAIAIFMSDSKIRRRYIISIFMVSFLTSAVTGFDVREWVSNQKENYHAVIKDQLNNPLGRKYKAPEIAGVYDWFNSEPLKIAELKDKVILIDFWTYSCINCVRTIPHINSWHNKYADEGLVIIGVHSPEFAFEAQAKNVEKAIKKFKIKYPVALDNDFVTWKKYRNKYWPAHYLIDKEGNVVYSHFGEGKYKVTENNIRYLLGLDKVTNKTEEKSFVSKSQTHEIYLGKLRTSNEVIAGDVYEHHWKISGEWWRGNEYLETQSKNAELILNYKAKNVYLVMESLGDRAREVAIYNNDKFVKKILVKGSDIYELVDNEEFTNGLLRIEALDKGIRLFAFTFGS